MEPAHGHVVDAGGPPDGGRPSDRPRWHRGLIGVGSVVVLAALVVLGWGTFVGSSRTVSIAAAVDPATGIPAVDPTTGAPTVSGQVVWATECPGNHPSLPGVQYGSSMYLLHADERLDTGSLPKGDRVQITRYWFRSPAVVFLADDGRRVALHHVTRFLTVVCPIY